MPFNFDPSALESKLPKPGTHNATVQDITINEGDDASWMAISIELESGHIVEKLVCIDADETSPHLTRVGEGISLMGQLSNACGIDIATLTEADAIMDAFIGKKVGVLIVIKSKAGAKSPFIKMIKAAASSDA